MKRYIRGGQQLPNFTDLFDTVDAIIIVDDVNLDYSRMGIMATTITGDVDYDAYTKRKLAMLSEEELNEIDTIGALNNLYEMCNMGFPYSLNTDQKRILKKEWGQFTDYRVTQSDVREVLKMISECDKLPIPSPRLDTSKNFASDHGLYMRPEDYLNILKEVKASECTTKFTGVRDHLGKELFVFVHPGNNYKLLNPQETASKQYLTDDIKIYIKIEVNPKTKRVLSFVSFHDPDEETQPMFPDYYGVSDQVYKLADNVLQQVNAEYSRIAKTGKIKNQFRYDTISFKDTELTIVFVDSYDEDFSITVNVTTPITDSTIQNYTNILVEKLIKQWNEREKFYAENYGWGI